MALYLRFTCYLALSGRIWQSELGEFGGSYTKTRSDPVSKLGVSTLTRNYLVALP